MNARRGTSTVARRHGRGPRTGRHGNRRRPQRDQLGTADHASQRERVELQDADFSKHNVAVAWQEPGSGGPRMRVRSSVHSGSAFGPTTTFQFTRQAALDICAGSELHLVFAGQTGSATWGIQHAAGIVGSTGFFVSPLSDGWAWRGSRTWPAPVDGSSRRGTRSRAPSITCSWPTRSETVGCSADRWTLASTSRTSSAGTTASHWPASPVRRTWRSRDRTESYGSSAGRLARGPGSR